MEHTRITFDFNGDLREPIEKLERIICSSHWASGIDIFTNPNHKLLIEFVKRGVIIIDECAYELLESNALSENAREIQSMLGKQNPSKLLDDIAILFVDETLQRAEYYRNTIYLPNLKAYMRMDGMKPEDIAEMLASDKCDKIIIFPCFPLNEKQAYYEISLGIPKEEFADFMKRVERQQMEEMSEAIVQANVRSKAGYKAVLRRETKADRDTVERITYRAFLNAEHAGGDEALLARKLRNRPAFVPELDFVAELGGTVIGNIMYTKSKIVNDDEEWETLTFGPVSVLPKYQREGVGSALIRKTLDAAREFGYRAVLIFGHENYYPRFGFKPASEYEITTADGENFPAFMALPLYDGALDGVHGKLICDEIYTNLDKAESDALNAKLLQPMNVDEYIEAQPGYYQQFLRRVRATIRAAIPNAAEKISYQMPTFWDGCNLIHFAAFKRHIGIYPGAEAMVHFKAKLYRYKTSKGAVQFPYEGFGDEQLALISEIAVWTATVYQCTENNAKQI